MSKSLSIILPVHNAESKLQRYVLQLLEIATDLSDDIELMVIDDGSTDNTEETAMELCRQYPQVRTIRHSQAFGQMNAVRVGISRTGGDVVLIQNMDAPISSEAIRELWEMRNDEELVFARSEAAHSQAPPAMHSQPTWSGGTQMLRREAIQQAYELPKNPPQNPKPSVKRTQDSVRINRVTRTDLVETPTTPAMFQQTTNIPIQPDR